MGRCICYTSACVGALAVGAYFFLQSLEGYGPFFHILPQADPIFNGECDSKWQKVCDVFKQHYEKGFELNSQLTIYHKKKRVVHIYGQSDHQAAAEQGQNYDFNSMQPIFSTSKVLESLAISMAVDKGWLDFNEPIATYWPEFAQFGKENITLRALMRHEAGLSIIDEPLPHITKASRADVARAFEKAKPLWPVHAVGRDTPRAYHAVTRGLIACALLERVDPQHRSIEQFLNDEVINAFAPSDQVDFKLSVEPNDPLFKRIFRVHEPPLWHTVVTLVVPWFLFRGLAPWQSRALHEDVSAMFDSMLFSQNPYPSHRFTIFGKRLADDDDEAPPADATDAEKYMESSISNTHDLCAKEQCFSVPSASGLSNAQSLARIMAVLAAGGDAFGVHLLSERGMRAALSSCTREFDAFFGLNTTVCASGWTRLPYSGGAYYGWVGKGGSTAAFDAEQELAIGYTPTGLLIHELFWNGRLENIFHEIDLILHSK